MPPEAPSFLARFPAGSVTPVAGLDQETWIVRREALLELCRELRTSRETRFDLLLEVFGMDYPERPDEMGGRFECVYHLYSIPTGRRLRLKVPLSATDPSLPSLIPVWKGADWFEREAWDMFGFRFDGHPHLRRILTHDGFQGHPLRKDYDPATRWILTEDKIYTPKFDLPDKLKKGVVVLEVVHTLRQLLCVKG